MRRAGLFLLLIALSPAQAKADSSLEYAVKAAYLPKFIPFITWPENALASGAPFTICELGPDRFEGRLDRTAAGERLGDHAVQVRHLAGPDPTANCQVLFLPAGSDPALVQGTLDAMRGHPVVTVTDSGVRARGVISFVIQDNHVRFDIDEALAAEGGLSISSKLLGLAHAVRTRGQP
jgi:YfiR/HmsC-like